MIHVRDERCDVGVCMASFQVGSNVKEFISSVFGCTNKGPDFYQCTSNMNGQQDDGCPVWQMMTVLRKLWSKLFASDNSCLWLSECVYLPRIILVR